MEGLVFDAGGYEALGAEAFFGEAMDPAVAHAICDAADPVAAFCADRPLWGDLAGDARLVGALRRASERVAQFVASHGSA